MRIATAHSQCELEECCKQLYPPPDSLGLGLDFLDSSWSPKVSVPRRVEQKLEEEKSMVGRRGLALARAQITRALGELEVELVADLVAA